MAVKFETVKGYRRYYCINNKRKPFQTLVLPHEVICRTLIKLILGKIVRNHSPDALVNFVKPCHIKKMII